MAEIKKTAASEEQIAYANVLNIGKWFGFFILVISFIVYISGLLPTFIPIDDLPKCWGMKVHECKHVLNGPKGLRYLLMVDKGDCLIFIGIVFLLVLTILCYIAILPILIRKKDTPYVVIAIVEVLVLVLAASGILTVGGH